MPRPRQTSPTRWPCASSTSACRSRPMIFSGVYRCPFIPDLLDPTALNILPHALDPVEGVRSDTRTSFRATMSVTISSALLYFILLAEFVPGPRNEYLMRAAYLTIVGYLIGFMGRQRAKFEARVRDLEVTADRHKI